MATAIALRNLRTNLREVLKKLSARYGTIPRLIAEFISLLRRRMTEEARNKGILPPWKAKQLEDQIYELENMSRQDYRYTENKVSGVIEAFKSFDEVCMASIFQTQKENFNNIDVCFFCQKQLDHSGDGRLCRHNAIADKYGIPCYCKDKVMHNDCALKYYSGIF